MAAFQNATKKNIARGVGRLTDLVFKIRACNMHHLCDISYAYVHLT